MPDGNKGQGAGGKGQGKGETEMRRHGETGTKVSQVEYLAVKCQ